MSTLVRIGGKEEKTEAAPISKNILNPTAQVEQHLQLASKPTSDLQWLRKMHFFASILGRLPNDSSHASLLLTTNVKEERTQHTAGRALAKQQVRLGLFGSWQPIGLQP